MRVYSVAISAAVFLAGCSDNSAGSVTNYDAAAADLQNQSATFNADAAINASAVIPTEQPAARAHNYDFSEGDLYGYVGSVSEDNQKRGIAAPPVVRFRYTGMWDGSQHLQAVDDNGLITESDECSVPCVAIKETFYNGAVSRVGYTTGSIIGEAFEDAINGRLRRSPIPGTVKNGYRFRGGDPADSANWQLIASPSTGTPSTPTAEPPAIAGEDPGLPQSNDMNNDAGK